MKIFVALFFTGLLAACAPAPSVGSSSQDSGGSAGDIAPPRAIGFTELSSGAAGRMEVALQTDGKTRMVIRLSGLRAGSNHAAHVHSGSCQSLGALTSSLTEVSADASGRAVSTSTVDSARIPQSAYVMVHERAAKAANGPGVGIACATIR